MRNWWAATCKAAVPDSEEWRAGQTNPWKGDSGGYYR